MTGILGAGRVTARETAGLWVRNELGAKPQELPLPWPCHRTLLLVHLELELGGDESRKALHHPFPGSAAANVNVAIVRIPRKPKFASLQLSIELVEYDVTEQGRQYSSNAKDNFSFDRVLRYR